MRPTNEVIVRFRGPRRELPGAVFVRAHALPDTYVYRVEAGFSLQAQPEAEGWEDADDIAYAEPNTTYRAQDAAAIADPLLSQAWGFTAVRATQAWPTATGEGLTVAVLDTGVNAAHPDLRGRVLPGLDLVNGDADAADDQGHGTHVAGTVAAIAGNGEGVAGVAPGCRILPIKVLAANGEGDNATIAAAILEAARRGARVINLSLGGPTPSETMRRAIAQVQSQGVVVVAAAGNAGVKTPFYPAAFEGVIGVGAVDRGSRKASFSNDGHYVDLAAPGVDILSTGYQGGYVRMNGTSMAAPHVAGAAAILLAAHGKLRPAQVAALMAASGAPASGFTVAAPHVLDVPAALAGVSALDLEPPTLVGEVVAAPGAPGEVQLSWPAAQDGHGVTGYRVLRDEEPVGTTSAPTFRDVGLRSGQAARYRVVAYDAAGNESAPSAPVSGRAGTPSPRIRDLRVVARTSASVRLAWRTDSPMRGAVDWGTDRRFGARVASTAPPSTTHEATIDGLGRFRRYGFRVSAVDDQGGRHFAEPRVVRTKLWFLFAR